MKRLSIITLMCLTAIACQRTEPVGTEGFTLRFRLPEEFKAELEGNGFAWLPDWIQMDSSMKLPV